MSMRRPFFLLTLLAIFGLMVPAAVHGTACKSIIDAQLSWSMDDVGTAWVNGVTITPSPTKHIKIKK